MIDFMQYAELVDVLNQWTKEYAAGDSSVGDDVYNKKYLELKAFEAANPEFILDNSPTRHVVDGAVGFRKVVHEIPMISISNSNGIGETREWAEHKFNEGVKAIELEYKIDGLGLALCYRDGVFHDAITRGVDNVGDSVWENALQIPSIPHRIDAMGEVEIRGEVVWKYDDFDAFNEQLADAGKKLISNPRNGATGTLKLHDPEEVGRRKLSFIGYIVAKGSPNQSQLADIEWISSMGFEVPPHYIAHNVDELVAYAEDLRMRRFDQAYTIDGVVLKVDDKSMHKKFGYTAKSPNFYRAYKFPPEEKQTELVDIEQSIGMSGAITPVAILKPVKLAMTTVQRCTLHNWDLVEYLGLRKGSMVTLRKAGEIIPEIVSCDDTGRTKDDYEVLRTRGAAIEPYCAGNPGYYSRPAVCPFCGCCLKNATNDSGDKLVSWVCDNDACYTQFLGKLVNFGSRTAMAIHGLGESVAEALYDAGKVRKFSDLYRLTVESISGIDGIKGKNAEKLVGAISESKRNYLHQLIEGLSVKGIGHQASPVIAAATVKYGKLSAAMESGTFPDECISQGVPAYAMMDFVEWCVKNMDEIRFFEENGIAQEVKNSMPASSKLAGKVCIMTGVFEKLDRDVFKDMVVSNGGTVCSSITKKCNLVLMGDGAGPSKVAKIDELRKSGQQIDVYTPDTLQSFLDLLK